MYDETVHSAVSVRFFSPARPMCSASASRETRRALEGLRPAKKQGTQPPAAKKTDPPPSS
eukprot:2061772-Prymnesium_polylepis.1